MSSTETPLAAAFGQTACAEGGGGGITERLQLGKCFSQGMLGAVEEFASPYVGFGLQLRSWVPGLEGGEITALGSREK